MSNTQATVNTGKNIEIGDQVQKIGDAFQTDRLGNVVEINEDASRFRIMWEKYGASDAKRTWMRAAAIRLVAKGCPPAPKAKRAKKAAAIAQAPAQAPEPAAAPAPKVCKCAACQAPGATPKVEFKVGDPVQKIDDGRPDAYPQPCAGSKGIVVEVMDCGWAPDEVHRLLGYRVTWARTEGTRPHRTWVRDSCLAAAQAALSIEQDPILGPVQVIGPRPWVPGWQPAPAKPA